MTTKAKKIKKPVEKKSRLKSLNKNFLGKISFNPNYMPYLLCVPVILILVFFFLIPSLTQLSLSFYTYLPPGTIIGKRYEAIFTLENYFRFFTPTYLDTYFWPTIRIMLISTPIALLLSYPVAYSIARSSKKMRKIYLVTTLLALFVGTIARVYSWYVLLGNEGIINEFVTFFGFGQIRFLGTELGVILGAIPGILPYLILVLSASIQNINSDFEDAARSLGADDVDTFTKVTLPLSSQGIISAALLGLLTSSCMLLTPMMLGLGFTKMQGNLIYSVALVSSNYPFSAAASVVLLIMALTISYGVNYLLKSGIKWMK